MALDSGDAHRDSSLLLKQAWECAWIDKKPKRAIGLLREALIMDPLFADPQLEIAKICCHLLPERMDLAEIAIKSFQAVRPDSADGHYYRTTITARLGDSVDAENYYRKAIELDPFDQRPLGGLARLLLKVGRSLEAISLLEQAVEWFSVRYGYGEPATRFLLAEAYVQVGDIPKAIEQWKIVVTIPALWPEDDEFNTEAAKKLQQYQT